LYHFDADVFRARGITKKLLGFSRRTEPRPTLTNVNKLLDDVVSGLKEREFALSNIKLIRDYDLKLPKLLIDRDEMAQVFLNLINNAGDAIHESPTGGGTITLATRHDDNHVRISVTDTGVGMEPEQMKKIFLPFFTTKEVGKGTGLGLSVSLSIVESVGGTIEVQSVPGAGSSFTVVLPITHGPEEKIETKPTSQTSKT
jgi:two-component system NtrC family sensor kinase